MTNTRLPQVMGLEWAKPGIACFHLTFDFVATSQTVGGLLASTIPAPAGPRNEGQSRVRGVVEGAVEILPSLRPTEL